jgi:hypothetical protein
MLLGTGPVVQAVLILLIGFPVRGVNLSASSQFSGNPRTLLQSIPPALVLSVVRLHKFSAQAIRNCSNLRVPNARRSAPTAAFRPIWAE